MIQEALYTHLSTDPVVAGLAGARIYPLMIPQHVYNEATRLPCLVYQRLGVDRRPTFCSSEGLIATTVRIDSYARSLGAAAQLGAAVRESLIDYTGAMGAVTVKKVLMETELDLLDVEPGLYRVSQTYSVWHLES